MHAALDLPSASHPSDPLTLTIQGWLFAGPRHTDVVAVEAVADGGLVLGRTALLYPRADVAAALGVPPAVRTGFSILGGSTELVTESQTQLSIRACYADGSQETVLSRTVPLTGRDYRKGDWGILVDPAFPHLVRREHMYNSGPPLDAPSGDLLALLDRYLPDSPRRVLDVGCGRGPYAEPLRARGYDWFGVEISAENCAALEQACLPHCRVDGQHLPFGPGEFDAAICVEVLEHVPDPWSFVSEVRRVLRGRLIVSVPNLEVVTYWRPHLAVPWHLLESDHRNFFSRTSLRELLRKHFRSVEVLSYGQAPLRTAEGAAVDYHLLAIADA